MGFTDMKENRLKFSMPDPDALAHDIARQAGYRSVDHAGTDVMDEVITVCEDVFRIIHPEYVFDKTSLDSWEDGTIYGEGITIRSGNWSALLSCMESPEIICSFAVTLGKDIDREIAVNQDLFMLHAYLLDVAGSVLAEHFADQAEQHISGILDGYGYQSTKRFSPGYCDWELKDGQTNIFGFLKPDSIGLRIDSSGLMIPKKSISAAIIGAHVIPHKTPCRFCESECDYRRG